MKCDFCGGSLSLEDEKCPFCGRPNRQAQQHIKDMKRYRAEFGRTKEDVYSTAKRFSELSVRIVIASVLVVLIIVTGIVSGKMYSIEDKIQRSKAERNFARYSAIMDEYLEEQDFVAFQNFCDEHHISWYESKYSIYAPVFWASGSYRDIRENVMRMVYATGTADGERLAEMTAESLRRFYEFKDPERFSYIQGVDREENLRAVEAVETQIKQMLETYWHLTQEEAESLEGMSKGKITVLLEERLTDDQ